MRAYLFRRLLQTVPTLGGVILITFILFHAVGGSPAALTLGEQASALALEEFDEVRGFNKPLLAGRWSRTRALPDGRFDNPHPVWREIAGGILLPADDKTPVARLKFPANSIVRLPIRFRLRDGENYRLTLRIRSTQTAVWFNPDPGRFATEGFQALDSFPTRVSKGWKTVRIDFTAGDSDDPVPELSIGPGGVEVERILLRRRMRHLFDSQLLHYLGRMAHLDFGVSYRENQRVAVILRQGIGPSLALTLPIFFGEIALALGLSLICVSARNSGLDRMITWISVSTMSVNYLVWIIVGQYVFAYRLGWFPVWGAETWRHFLLPVAIGIASSLGTNVRFYRTVLLEETLREYVRTARARGAGRARILWRHILPNAMIPILTSVVVSLPFLYTGSLLLESFFGIPGLGYVGVNAIASSDADVLRAVVLIGSVLYMAANLLTDALYAAVDPRVRLT